MVAVDLQRRAAGRIGWSWAGPASGRTTRTSSGTCANEWNVSASRPRRTWWRTVRGGWSRRCGAMEATGRSRWWATTIWKSCAEQQRALHRDRGSVPTRRQPLRVALSAERDHLPGRPRGVGVRVLPPEQGHFLKARPMVAGQVVTSWRKSDWAGVTSRMAHERPKTAGNCRCRKGSAAAMTVPRDRCDGRRQ